MEYSTKEEKLLRKLDSIAYTQNNEDRASVGRMLVKTFKDASAVGSDPIAIVTRIAKDRQADETSTVSRLTYLEILDTIDRVNQT